jgi:predicted transcriptional regulator
MQRARKPLSDLENLVMGVVWMRRSVTAEGVRESLASKHPMKESTVRTVLTRLEEKGYIRHSVHGRTNVYRATEEPENVAACAVRQIIERFCGGSVEQFLLGMVDNDVLKEDELEKLARRIAEKRERGK